MAEEVVIVALSVAETVTAPVAATFVPLAAPVLST